MQPLVAGGRENRNGGEVEQIVQVRKRRKEIKKKITYWKRYKDVRKALKMG